ncbi:MAG: c-type cytochrome [Steroidobacteraceae bacterium]
MVLKSGSAAALLAIAALSGAAEQGTPPPPAVSYDEHVSAGGVPPPAGELRNPYAGNAETAKAGERLFTSINCDGCHGGGGTGFVGPSLADGRWRYGGRDGEVFHSIFYGRPKGMPAYGGAIGSEGTWILVTYLNSLPQPDVVPTQSWIESKDSEPRPNQHEKTADSTPAPMSAPDANRNFDTRLNQYGCTACHAIDSKMLGPAYREIAGKYRTRQDAEQKLMQSVKNGSAGVWSNMPMPPNPGISDADLRGIVKQILALK